jgi:hypothetical protein
MRKLYVAYPVLLILMSLCFCSCDNSKTPFSFIETDEGLELLDNEIPVFFYQREPKSSSGEYICNNYIHPLYSLTGDTLTEEFPSDHPYHRGIFWTWHQLYRGNNSIGDGWINEGIEQEVISVATVAEKDRARIDLTVLWRSAYLGGDSFLRENTTITVYKPENEVRKIDFKITLNALIDSLEIGGSADEKGYGGFCARIKLPDNIIFTSENGSVIPQNLQIESGPWMDFSGRFGEGSAVSGMSILCHRDTPDYPQPWILRQKYSMQNIVFPGQNRISIIKDKPVVLKYRLIIHEGGAESIDLQALQAEYSGM